VSDRLRRWIATALLLFAFPASEAWGGPGAGQSPSQTPAPVVVRVADNGFHWGDAGLGAAAAIGLVLLAAGLAAARQH
jgi:hypothetical protein